MAELTCPTCRAIVQAVPVVSFKLKGIVEELFAKDKEHPDGQASDGGRLEDFFE